MSAKSKFRGRRLVMVAAATLAVFGSMLSVTSSASADGTATTTDGPTYQMPAVGECHHIAWKNFDKMSDATPTIDCANAHNDVVVATTQMPAGTDWTRGSADLDKAVTNTCVPAVKSTLGQSYRVIAKTAYVVSVWIPTKDQRSHGASWVRCDVNLVGNQRLLQLRQHLRLKSTSIPRRLRACLMVRPKGSWSRVSCSGRFNWTITRVFVVPGKAYPTVARFRRFAASHCPTKNYWATWRAKVSWKAGDHTLVCYRHVRA